MQGPPDGNFENLRLAEVYLSFVLNGEEIHLVDEWQEAPAIRYHEAVEFNKSYIRNVSDRDVAHMNDRERDSRKFSMLIRSLARNESTVAGIATLVRDRRRRMTSLFRSLPSKTAWTHSADVPADDRRPRSCGCPARDSTRRPVGNLRARYPFLRFRKIKEMLGLEAIFTFWNLWPRQILSDHGAEFYSVTAGRGNSKLDIWCRNHGIEHVMGRVSHPQTQGKIERSHGSAKMEMGAFGPTDSLADARESIAAWVKFYNTERPHQALDYRTPLEHFMARLSEEGMEAFLDG